MERAEGVEDMYCKMYQIRGHTKILQYTSEPTSNCTTTSDKHATIHYIFPLNSKRPVPVKRQVQMESMNWKPRVKTRSGLSEMYRDVSVNRNHPSTMCT